MNPNQPNIPNTGQKTVTANIKIKSFASPPNPSNKELEKYEKEVNAFLATIDNQNRFLNGRNSYAIGNKAYTLVWYLERIPEEPVTTPFGVKNDKPNNTQEGKDK